MFSTLLLLVCLLTLPLAAWSTNTHGQSDPTREMQAVLHDAFVPYVVRDCVPAVPASGLTLAAVACAAYVPAEGRLVYVYQAAVPVGPLPSADGLTFLAVVADTIAPVPGWTRQAGTHYVYQQAATKPADPPAGLVVAQVTVAGAVVTAVSALGNPNPVLSSRLSVGKDVRECGAKVDGVTDDSTALQRCLNTYTHVMLPLGTLRYATPITLPAFRTLAGGGEGSTLEFTGTGKALSFDPGTGFIDGAYLHLRDFTVRSVTPNATHGLYVKDASEMTITAVRISGNAAGPDGDGSGQPAVGNTTAGLTLDSTFPSSAVIVIHLSGVRIKANKGLGVEITGANNANALVIDGNSRIQGNLGKGVVLTASAKALTIRDSDIEGNFPPQLDLSGCAPCIVSGNYFEQGGGDQIIYIRGGVNSQAQIVGNFVSGGATAAIQLGTTSSAVSGSTVQGNTISVAGTYGVLAEQAQNSTLGPNECFSVTTCLQAGAGGYGGTSILGRGETSVKKIAQSFVATAQFNNSVADTTLYSVTIPARALYGTANGATVRVWGQVANATGADQEMTLRVKLGATTLVTYPFTGLTTSGAFRLWSLDLVLGGLDTTHLLLSGGTATLSGPGATGAAVAEFARLVHMPIGIVVPDVTAAQTLSVTAQMGVAAANMSVQGLGYHVLGVPW